MVLELPPEQDHEEQLPPELPEAEGMPEVAEIPDLPVTEPAEQKVQELEVQRLAPEVSIPENFGRMPDTNALPPFTEIINGQEFEQGLPEGTTLDSVVALESQSPGPVLPPMDDRIDQILQALDEINGKLDAMTRAQEDEPKGYGP